jgi:hypothetical protein
MMRCDLGANQMVNPATIYACMTKLWHDKDYPKIQILTIEGLLNSQERVEAPPQLNPFAKAQREGKTEKQTDLI